MKYTHLTDLQNVHLIQVFRFVYFMRNQKLKQNSTTHLRMKPRIKKSKYYCCCCCYSTLCACRVSLTCLPRWWWKIGKFKIAHTYTCTHTNIVGRRKIEPNSLICIILWLRIVHQNWNQCKTILMLGCVQYLFSPFCCCCAVQICLFRLFFHISFAIYRT